MSSRSTWQKLGERRWEEVRDTWLANIPIFPNIGARPNPGLEKLDPLLSMSLQDNTLYADILGLRAVVLWEAVFLFHKCSHTNLAAQRLGRSGMYSWSLFNAYHSAYLGARGILALLGVGFPNLAGLQVAVDLYPEPSKKKGTRLIVSSQFHEFLILRLKNLDQRDLWQAFQRVIRMCDADCWDSSIRDELQALPTERITPPRNHFLYKANYWPLNDLISDERPLDYRSFFGAEFDIDSQDFLLRLSFCVYRLFEQLMDDLGLYSQVIKEQIHGSRFHSSDDPSEIECYEEFLSARQR